MNREPIVVVSPYRIEYGPPQTLGHVARALSAGGYQPICVVPPGARRTDDLARAKAEVQVISGLETFPRTLNLPRLGSFFRRHLDSAHEIEALVRARGAGAVYSISEATFAGGLAARWTGVASIVHVIGMSIQSPRLGAHVYVRLLDRLTDHFVACSSAVADMLIDHGVPDPKVTVVHNGIAVEEIERTATGPAPVDEPGPRIGMIAAYDPRKGHELFVEAAALVAKRYPEARFYLIGGPLEGQADSLAFEHQVRRLIRDLELEERFRLPGYIPPPDVYRWIRAMDVVVVPSKTEAFAHALTEAMLCRTAVVATAIQGNLDAFVDGHSGLYAESTAESIAARLSELLDDPERSRTIGENAHRRARLFGLDVTLPALAEIVRRVLERAGPGAVDHADTAARRGFAAYSSGSGPTLPG